MHRKRGHGLRRWAQWWLLSGLAVLVVSSGCSEEVIEDPYVYGSLRGVTRGAVESKNFLFEIEAPEFVFIRGNTGFVKDGNLLEVVVADDLENRVTQFQGQILGVEKRFKPFVHLAVRRVKNKVDGSIVELDSLTAVELPNIVRSGVDAEIPGMDLGDLRYNNKKDIEDRMDNEFQTVGRLERRPDHEAENPDEAPLAWYLLAAEDDEAVFKVENVTPKLEFAFDLLEAYGYPLVGSVTVTGIYDWPVRRNARVGGPIQVNWLKFGNRYLGS